MSSNKALKLQNSDKPDDPHPNNILFMYLLVFDRSCKSSSIVASKSFTELTTFSVALDEQVDTGGNKTNQ
jgi:hypothetical protein